MGFGGFYHSQVCLISTLAALGCHPHQSWPRFRRAEAMTASPSREKPLVVDHTFLVITDQGRHRTRLLPPGRHPRVASLATSGQFTFSCQPLALRNQWLTDVGHRRRRHPFPPRDDWHGYLYFPFSGQNGIIQWTMKNGKLKIKVIFHFQLSIFNFYEVRL